MSRVARKRLQGFQPVLTKTGQFATGLKFRIKVVKGLCYICSENKGADQLHGYRAADTRLCFQKRSNDFKYNWPTC